MEQKYDFKTLSIKVEDALREHFKDAGVFVSEGYSGRVHVKIVSKMLDSKNNLERQAYIYDVLRDKLGEDSEGVSLVMAYGADEL